MILCGSVYSGVSNDTLILFLLNMIFIIINLLLLKLITNNYVDTLIIHASYNQMIIFCLCIKYNSYSLLNN